MADRNVSNIPLNDETTAAAYITAPNNTNKTKKTYRTKSRAGDTEDIPDRLPIITNSTYQYALSFNENCNAYLQPLSDCQNLKYKDGVLSFRGLPATSASLHSLYTEEKLERFNLPLLLALYGIVLSKMFDVLPENQISDASVTIYYPDFAKIIGKAANIGKADVQECFNDIKHFETVIGIINGGTNSHDILPILSKLEYNAEKNAIHFTSPYMFRIIRDIYETSIRKNKKGQAYLKKNGKPEMYPSHSYLIDMSIVKERNKKAVEIVLIVVTLIEQAGTHTPHIKAETIVDRNPLLHKNLNTVNSTTGNKNILLARAFTKAWELLREKTALNMVYRDIQLPDPHKPEFIPTCSTLGMLFEFPHNGKSKELQFPYVRKCNRTTV
ncbi:MAG: hypothetical protein K2N34_10335 [Lachnospiraceae bacterium]|nr:hypothetical protein [Lachnospiraceae bacterium]